MQLSLSLSLFVAAGMGTRAGLDTVGCNRHGSTTVEWGRRKQRSHIHLHTELLGESVKDTR